jgi:hypothetical protein
MPYEVENHYDCGSAMENSSGVETLFYGKERFQEFNVIEEQRKASDNQNEKSDDEDEVLNPFSQIHPHENFIIPDKKFFFRWCVHIIFKAFFF